ncbi:hypothetical protein KRP22_012161 [Phytophthora ramorum]|nr:hypothetical protein KRP22_14864 [Phytophthora ramorum]
MKMEALAYLARSDSSDDDWDASDGRPTPLDPEYWRGITHSVVPAPATYTHADRMESPHSYDHYAPPASYPMYHPHQRPVSSPSHFGGGVLMSPIHYQAGPPMVPISPVAHMDAASYGAPMHRPAEWSSFQPRSFSSAVSPVATPQQLKHQVREALVRAQAFLDLVPFFQSYDLSYAGGVRLGTIQEALGRMGVILGDHILQRVGQLFSIPGSGLVDYVAFGRFLELDAQELDNMRSMVAARRSILVNSGLDLGDIFVQYDSHRTGFVSRSMFATLLRDYSISMPETTLHFLMIQLAKPSDTTSVSYVRFLEITDVGVARSASANPPLSHGLENSPARFSSWTSGRSNPFEQESAARGYAMQNAVPVATQPARVVNHASASPEFATPLLRLGWVCRVCAHQQIVDWATHCEICETSKPRPGLRGEGYIKCLQCKFDNNYDMEECEMCGRPLNASNKKMSKSEKKRRSRKRYVSSSSSSSPSSSSSSSSSGHRRSSRRKFEKQSRSARSSRKKEEKKPRFQRGEEIQAIPLGRRGYEIGVIARVRPNGTYDIEFDSGLYEKNVEEDCVLEISRARVIKAKDLSDSEETKPKAKCSDDDNDPGYEPGDRVEARFQGNGRFFAGTIKKCRTGGLYDIEYDDGEVELRVRSKYIKREEAKNQRKPSPKEDDVSTSEVPWAKGQKVEAKLRGCTDYVRCVVFHANADGSCDVELDTGELEKRVPGRNIRARVSSPIKARPTVQSEEEPVRPKRPLVKRPSAPSTSEDSCAQPKWRFKQGQAVEAKPKGRDGYFPGVIARCRLNGSYDIDFDDGEKVLAVSAITVRAIETAPAAKKTTTTASQESLKATIDFKVGQPIEAQYKSKSKFYPGVISRCRLNGTYDIDYDDGEKETGVAAELIRAVGKKSGADSDDGPKQKKFKEGDKVEAQYKGKSKFYPGVISRCRLNGTYDIDYDDGEKETGVAAELIRAVGKKSGADSDDGPKQKKFKEGDKVEAQYKGKSKFYPGVISRCRLNGTYDIDYDDGEKETGVAAELIRAVGKKGGADSDDGPKQKKFKEGDKVEAQYKGKSKFYPGVISRCRLNGTYDIDYDDGEKETGVAAELIRAVGKKGGADSDDGPKQKKFKEGDKVEAQYKGKSKFYPGVISRCRLNGTYDIDYDDGEKETGVAAELIRAVGKKGGADSDDGPKQKKFKEGDKVEAQYKGKSKFYPGVISRCRLNGTYDIDYDDGEKETGVAAELIRAVGKKGGADSDDGPKQKKFKEGDKVEAQYKGKSKFYPGVISRCRLNGTYDIDYDDGEKETGVAAELIRAVGKKSGADSDDGPKQKKFKEGDKVEAQYKGKSKFYPGVISRCRLNDTYDIDYDDGEKETGVAAELIRAVGKKSGADSDDGPKQKKFKEGDKVEAQYKGKSKFYPGVISRCRLNGTYDIDYDDGEKETGVAAELIRAVGKKSGADSDDGPKQKKFKEGDKVEAQYKGKSKFYPGVISRCRLNDTYDIDYDDGEKETGVAAELIRAVGKKSGADSDDGPKQKKFKEGDKVEAQYKGKSKFYPGVISRCRLNGTYDIDYDDGEKETGVAAELIRAVGKKSGADSDDGPKQKKFKEGDKVEAQYKGKSKFYPGVISRCRLNGTYDIDYDDGEKETGVAAELIRAVGKKGGADSDDGPKQKKFKEGDKVEAQYKGKSKFYPGVISRCRLNGTYDIDYDDGEKETGVAAELIRAVGKKGGADSDDGPKQKKFKEGDKVEAQYKGKSKFYPGVISRCRLNDTYDIDYDDGEKETGVAAELIRAVGKKSGADSDDGPKQKKFKEGDKVEAQYKGKSKFYPGVISRCRLNGHKSGADSDDGPKQKKFKEGDKVEAQYKGKSKFYPGVISRCRLNGTYDIDYDDGEKETGVAAELIRAVGKKSGADSDDGPKQKKFKEGDKVEAQYKGKSKFYPGVISRCRLNGTYDIDYDDGEKETGVAAELIRAVGKKSGADSDDGPKQKKFKEGDKVEAQYKGKSKFYPGVISRCRLNGTYDIDYDDGEKETGVAAELIRAVGKKSGADSDDGPKQKKFKEGDKVEAQYKGKSKFYPGVISRCRLNGTYDIDYDDGEKETGVAAELIRAVGKKSGADSDDGPKQKKFKEGDKVEAQYKGKSKFYPGVISRCRLNGTYDIDYDDGEKETGVAAELIRAVGKKGGADSDDGPKQKKFKEGDKVEAQYKGKSKFYPGVISRCRLNGTYDIDYDDGEKETGVAAELIRAVGKKGGADSDDGPKQKKFKEGDKVEAQYKGKSKFYPGVISRCRLNGTGGADSDDGPKQKKFKEGDKVEAQYKGKSKFYPGVISRCRLNGTYDIDYDDGEKETGVAAELIRAVGKKGGADSDDGPKQKKFKEGDKVEAQYKGKSKFYPGVISRCRLNGTYDIDYDDGEKETGVAAELIRAVGKKSGADSDDGPKQKKFKEGDKVEAQYKGKSKFYPGVISRCRLNGTYDIDYDDGEKETGVAAELIRAVGKKSGADSDDGPKQKKFKEGDKVEAQYKGKSKFYPGVISRCRLNGTYDIDYDDGEKETGVAAELIRAVGKKSGADSDDGPKQKKFKEGDKVEAQYKGKSKFYPGVISRCRLNGTYDIDYDDGEKETGVAAELIRAVGKKSGADSDDGPKQKKFKEGDKVEAQYKGKSKFYPGVISRCRLNGTYDIDYDDGEKETGVAAELIRAVGKKSGADSDDGPKQKKFKEGDKVEAQYKGKSKFYPGVISRCRLNGTYDIDYDDGEKETGVAAELIRAVGKKSGADSDDGPKQKKFKEGDKVEAQYKGKSKFYPGVISRCRLNGTYDIDYDDGEKETGVAAELIRAVGKKSGADSDDGPKQKKFKEGDKVEAQYKGKSKFYPGVISRCRLNGTYDIDYDDGEKETGVAAELIRAVGKKSGADSDDGPKQKKFKEGDKVEAQYKGKSKFYPGVISRCRLNGTYDIDYDDGEKETGVAAELIRAVGKKSGADSDDGPKQKKFKEGDKVEAQYKGKSKFYPGVISRCRLNGTYDIDYDDGEKETGVAAELIRAVGKKSGADSDDGPKQKKFKEGDKVEAQYKGKSKFYPGVISRCRLNGTYDIDYDDGEKETGVAAELIRAVGKKSGADSDDGPKQKKFKEGDKVEAQYKGKSKFYPGVISRCRLNGTYDIDYDDGEKETGVAAELIRAVGKKSGADSDDGPKQKKFKEGDKVEAQYKGKSKFYPGVISRCRLNGTYDIDYDDGEKETGVAAELIRAVGKKSGADSDDGPKQKKFKEGDKVEAQYKGKSKFYPGVISRCRLNGTYDIDYDDGEKETGVAAELIRAKKFKEGDKVEAQYKGKSKFYPGVISRCRLNGTYDIDYDDGEKETGVAAELIRAVGKKSGADSDDGPKQKKFKEGDKVEAQYKGKSKFYPGVISRCRLNGTYDIDYDDGEKETGVAAELIRAVGKKSGADSDDGPKQKKFKEGDKVEAQYKGKSKFYPGVISRCRLNGTYDIDYDDGEKETGVAAELIRAVGKKGGADSDDGPKQKKFKEGDKVEAQYKGKSKFYPGVISRCRLNGTYDIDYDDGEKETGVAAELIRAVGKKSGADSDDGPKQKKFKEGDKVEAQYKGKSKFYPGVISRCRLNGTYDIDYDDGEKETGVAAELIRAVGKKSGADSDDGPKQKKFKEGDKVEAQYKGKSKFYPGVISRCRLNGTYDIDYDDGEKETGVAAELIRAVGKKGGADSDDGPKQKKFKEGDKVEAQYKGKSKFYPGVISRCRLNGTYDIDYDDGEKETGVAAELIRAVGKKSGADSDDGPKQKKFKEGDKVEAQYKGKSKFYPGVISRCRLNGTYDIDYDDGEKETGVAAELIRAVGKKGGADSDDGPKQKKFKEGDKVEAQYKGKSKFYPGVISRCRLNGTYDIDYDDGEKETGVAAELIRAVGKKSGADSDDGPKQKKFKEGDKKGGADSDDGPKQKKFKEGDKVEAQYKGKSKFYPGVISRCRLNGTYDIDYDDGEKETGVAAELIRAVGKKSGADSDDGPKQKKFKEGDKVEAQYKGKSKFYPGVISRCRLNGTYDIDYDDGEKETGVAAELIRAVGKKGGADSDDGPKQKKFKEGDKVEAQYKGKSKFYPGVISRCRLNGTYDIDYDDGEKETGVAAELIRAVGKKSGADSDDGPKQKKFKEGDKVEAQYKGKSKFYPGVISRCRLNGTYDIDYDDGEKETGVAAELIRAVGKKSGADSDDGPKQKKFKEGDKVEAQYKGKSKFYPGVISRCRLNGTYDIDYDDGEKETGVAAELIRAVGKKSGADSDDGPKQKKFKEGDKVEAQYKGKSKFYPGVISRCRLNGTYDIDYDDGEKETGVAAELIRAVGKKSGADSDDGPKQKKFKEGDKVEAQYKGKSKFYPGVISRCRLNGTYDIDYDDGEKETGVAAELIRAVGKKGGADSDDGPKQKKFKEGDKVEAQYKGKSKFYPGVISRCRLNGTYDIDYDDGEKETGVDSEQIRPVQSASMPKSKDNDASMSKAEAKGESKSVPVESSQTYRVGTRVEARYMGKDNYFKGTISRANADGTYVIEYDDGDKENRVPSSSIRALKSMSSFRGDDFVVGKPAARPNAGGSFRRRSGNSSD